MADLPRKTKRSNSAIILEAEASVWGEAAPLHGVWWSSLVCLSGKAVDETGHGWSVLNFNLIPALRGPACPVATDVSFSHSASRSRTVFSCLSLCAQCCYSRLQTFSVAALQRLLQSLTSCSPSRNTQLLPRVAGPRQHSQRGSGILVHSVLQGKA